MKKTNILESQITKKKFATLIGAGLLSIPFLPSAFSSFSANIGSVASADTLQDVTNRGAITDTSITAQSFIKTGGTSSQFLKADGSSDSSTYLFNNVGLSGGTTLIGGTGTTDDLILQTTSGVGATGANIIFRGGNNGATEFMRILNDGNVGIGTTNPQAFLDVGGYISSSAFPAGRPHIMISDHYNGISGVEMRNTSMGPSADFRFTVSDTEGNGLTFAQPGVNNTSTFFGITRGQGSFIFNGSGTTRDVGIGTGGNNKLVFGTNSTARMTILGNGNVGIGATSPQGTLVITSSGANTPLVINKAFQNGVRERLMTAKVLDDATSMFFINNGTITNGAFAPVFGGYTQSTTLWGLGFSGFTNASADASDSSNFGILDFAVFRTTNASDPLNGTLTSIQNRKIMTVRSLDNHYFAIAGNGNVGIGTTAPSAKTHIISTTEQLRVGFNASNYFNATVASNGLTTFDAVGSGAEFKFSDGVDLTQTVTTETLTANRSVTIKINGTTYKLLASA